MGLSRAVVKNRVLILVIALILNTKFRGRAIVRTLFLLPILIMTSAVLPILGGSSVRLPIF